MENTIIIFLGKILVYGGGGAAVAYVLFSFLGKKWIENKFSKSLEAYKHAQTKELEELRYKINAQFNRITKIHEKEFELLPEAWLKMQDALGRISEFTSLYQEFPDLNKMSSVALDEFLDKSKLQDYEKQELKKAPDKLEYYQECIFRYKYVDAHKEFSEFHNFIVRNRIFFSSDLQEKFIKIDDIMWSAIIDRKVGYEAKDHEMWTKAYKQIRDEVEPIKKEIEILVQQRLHFAEAE
jgi:hypothetical protein